MSLYLTILHFLVICLCFYISLNRELENFKLKEELLREPSPSLPSMDNFSGSGPVRVHPLPLTPIRPLSFSVKNQILDTENFSRPLEYDFYSYSCPSAERIVRAVVEDLYQVRSDVAPALLRLVFHDCFIQGCDASVLLDPSDGIDSEKESPPNETLRGFDLIDLIKSKLEEECPGVVSCADVLVLAARDSVALAGGPFYPVYTGRRDSTAAFSSRANEELPSPHDHLSLLLASFVSRGFNERETVSLFGAHSVGVIHCKFFESRLYDFDGSHEPDPSMDLGLLHLLRTKCKNSQSESSPGSQPCPTASPSPTIVHNSSTEEPGMLMNYDGSAFGTQYYLSLLEGKGILYIDQQLMEDEETANWVRAYAADASLFRRDFALAMMKLSDLQVLTAPMGQIRFSCSKVA